MLILKNVSFQHKIITPILRFDHDTLTRHLYLLSPKRLRKLVLSSKMSFVAFQVKKKQTAGSDKYFVIKGRVRHYIGRVYSFTYNCKNVDCELQTWLFEYLLKDQNAP